MNLHNTDQTIRTRTHMGLTGWRLAHSVHQGYRETRARGRDQAWEPYSLLALAILAQAVEDALVKSPRNNRWPTEIARDREEAILLLRSMEGDWYQDRLFWLEVAYPMSNPKEMDRLVQSRLDARRLPRL